MKSSKRKLKDDKRHVVCWRCKRLDTETYTVNGWVLPTEWRTLDGGNMCHSCKEGFEEWSRLG